jgi:hypothetical protein
MTNDSDHMNDRREPDQAAALVTSIARWLSKTGDLTAYAKELSALSKTLSIDEVVSLYRRLAEERLDFEWREQFIAYFTGSERYLPPLAITESDFQEALRRGDVSFVHKKP